MSTNYDETKAFREGAEKLFFENYGVHPKKYHLLKGTDKRVAIKYDASSANSKNLFITVYGKRAGDPMSHPIGVQNPHYGLLITGNNDEIWIFNTAELNKAYSAGNFRIVRGNYYAKQDLTQYGMLLPKTKADSYCVAKIDLRNGVSIQPKLL